MTEFELAHLTKPFLLWTLDPCPEGGWSIRSGHDTKEEAVQAAKAEHERGIKTYKDQVEFEKNSETPIEIKWGDTCYSGCIVTGGMVFRIDGIHP